MAEFYIGMYGVFNEHKYKRDFRSHIKGIEVCSFNSEEEVQKLLSAAQRDQFKIGIHFPMQKSSYKYRDLLILSQDPDERAEAFNALEKELLYAQQIGAEYILVHFPKPFIISKEIQWQKCNFNIAYDMVWESEYSFNEFEKNCWEAFRKLSDLSRQYRMQIILEVEILNKFLYGSQLLVELLEEFPNIKLCLDTARMHVNEKMDPAFNAEDMILKLGKYLYSIHLSNIKVTHKAENGHYPVLPDLQAADGWADIDRYLKAISLVNPDVKILFEHRSDLITDDELDLCYHWTASYFKGK